MKRILCIFKKPRVALQSDTAYYGLLPFINGKYDNFKTSVAYEEYFSISNSFNLLKKIYKADIIIASKFSNLFIFSKIFFFWKTFIIFNINLKNVILRSKKNILKRIFHKIKTNLADYIVCIAYDQIQTLVEIGIPKRKLIFMPFGVDTKYLQETAKKDTLIKKKNFFLAVGADSERDFDTLIYAIKKMPATNFVVVTNGRNQYLEMMKIPNVELFINLPFEKLIGFYKKADAILILTKKEEKAIGSDCSGQTVTLDSLALGKTVVASRKSWIDDYFADEKDAPLITVTPEDGDELIYVLKKIENKNLPENYSHNFSSENMTVSWLKLLNEI